MCSAHRARAQPGEGGLPGLDDDELGLALGLGLVGVGVDGSGEDGDEFRPRRGMGKSRKKQLSSKGNLEGGYGHNNNRGCCVVQ